MSNHLDDRADDGVLVEERRRTLLIPALLATCVGVPLIAISCFLRILAEVLFQLHPDWIESPGVTYVDPTASERVGIIIGAAVPIIAAIGFLVLTWRFRSQGRRVATLVCAAAVIVLGIVSLR